VYSNVINFDASLLDGRFGNFEFVMKKSHCCNMCGCTCSCSEYYEGGTVQFWACNSSRSSWYLFILVVIISGENLSLQYVNSMNWMVILWSEAVGELP
jgi:hypothetical protein